MNGYYRVIGIVGYREVDELLSDPVELLYDLAGKKTEYVTNKMMFNFRDQVHYILERVSDNVKFYVPEMLIAVVPDGTHIGMTKFSVTAEIGIFDNQYELEALVLEIQELIKDRVGIDATMLLGSFGKEYMSEDHVNLFKAARAAAKATQPTKDAELLKLRTEVNRLEGMTRHYEQWLTHYLTPVLE
jgi:hypothetical protein